VLLKSVKNWVFENKIADAEARLYLGEIQDESNEK